MYRIRFTRPAEEDLALACDYITEVLKSSEAAANLLDEVEVQVGLLAHAPLCHPLVRDTYLASLGIRSLHVKNYMVFYVVKEDEQVVSVLRFLYARRDWARLLGVDQD